MTLCIYKPIENTKLGTVYRCLACNHERTSFRLPHQIHRVCVSPVQQAIELWPSIRIAYDTGKATNSLGIVHMRVSRCSKCRYARPTKCRKISGGCGERYGKWIKAITTGPDDSWCPLLQITKPGD